MGPRPLRRSRWCRPCWWFRSSSPLKNWLGSETSSIYSCFCHVLLDIVQFHLIQSFGILLTYPVRPTKSKGESHGNLDMGRSPMFRVGGLVSVDAGENCQFLRLITICINIKSDNQTIWESKVFTRWTWVNKLNKLMSDKNQQLYRVWSPTNCWAW